MDEAGIFEWLFKAIATAFMGITSWFLKSFVDDMRELQKASNAHEVKHEQLRTHISENYSTKNDLNAARLELNETVKRVHERLDSLPGDIIRIIDRHNK